MTDAAPLLEARGATRVFAARGGASLLAVDGADLVLRRGESLGLVGESGCGKSTLGRMLCGLIPPTAGEIVFDGVPLPPAGPGSPVAGRLQMIFQDPFSSLNPRMTVGEAVMEPLAARAARERRPLSAEEREAVRIMFESIGLPGMEGRYPHEFSGGQRQRVAAARALITRPDVLICDEPVSALDASVQAQILNLLQESLERFGPACLFISHDLAVVGFMCPRIMVMHLGRVVEEGPREALLDDPAHPYARALRDASPHLADDGGMGVPAPATAGEHPSPLNPPPGCRFHPRCPHAMDACRREAPPWREIGPGRRVRCFLHA